MVVGRIREIAPRNNALMRSGSVEVDLVDVEAVRVAGVGILYREELMVYKGHLYAGNRLPTLNPLLGHWQLAQHGCSPGVWLRKPFIDKDSRLMSM